MSPARRCCRRPGDPPVAPLLVVTLKRTDVKNVVRRPKGTARMLRQGWLSGFRDVETMKPADLKEALADRGFAADAGGDQPVAIDGRARRSCGEYD